MPARETLHNRFYRILLLITLPATLYACAATPGKSANQGQSPASKMYSEGKEALSAGKYDMAIKQFSSLEALYPADPYTQQAQMELAYAHHKNGDATSAIATAERFIKNYPTHANADYAYYLRGLTSFEQAVEQLSSESIQKTQRRPLMAQLSLQYLTELVEMFPESKYSSDATRRIGFLRDKLAQYEVLLAKHSLEQGNYADAALHAKAAMENYPQAPAVTEAATITNEAYKMLGIASTVTAGNANVLDKTTMGTTTPDTSMHITNKKPNVVIPFKSSETQAQDNQQTKVKPAATISTATSENTGSAADDKQQDARITTAVQMKEDAQQQNNGIKQAPWLLTQNPSHYTIQLLGTGNERLLVALIKRLNITDKAAYYKNARLDKNWYALTYGTFPSLSEANEAIDQLPADLLKGQPWIRKFSDIHALIGDQ